MLAVHTPREWKTWVINLPQPMRVEIYLSSPKSPKSKKSASRHLGNSPSCLLMEGWNERQNHLGWKIPSRSSCPTISLTYWDPPLNHIPQCHIHTSFQYLQEWGVPVQPVTMLSQPLFEDWDTENTGLQPDNASPRTKSFGTWSYSRQIFMHFSFNELDETQSNAGSCKYNLSISGRVIMPSPSTTAYQHMPAHLENYK